MGRVDRNILPIATYIMASEADVPPSVLINEAIEISKLLSCPEAHQFINGVLDNIARAVRPDEVHKLKQIA